MSTRKSFTTENGKAVTYDELLFDMIKQYPVKRTPSDLLVQINQNGKKKNMSIGSEEFRFYVLKTFKDTYGGFASGYAIKNAIDYKKAEAFEKEITNTEIRVAVTKDNNVLYDLCNGNCVRITENGWDIVENDEMTFLENALQSEQVTPIKSERGWERLWKYLNLSDGEKLLYTVYLATCLYPKLTYPSITINGPQRSGKSTLSTILKKIIDPSPAEKEVFPESLDDLKVTLNKSYYTVFDNMSTVTKKQSDFLSSVITGTSSVSRKKFSDAAAFLITLKKGFCMNGITQYIKRDDFAERMLFIETQTIPTEDIDEDIFWESFNEDLPYIMGGIFDLLSIGLRDYKKLKADGTKLGSPIRWADFYRLAYSIAENIDHRGEEFKEYLLESKFTEFEISCDENHMVNLISDFLEECEGTWESSPEQLHKFLINFMGGNKNYKNYSTIFPKSANQMSRKLFEEQTTLLSKGIKLERDKTVDGRIIRIMYVEKKEDEPTENANSIKRVPIILNQRVPIVLSKSKADIVREYLDAAG